MLNCNIIHICSILYVYRDTRRNFTEIQFFYLFRPFFLFYFRVKNIPNFPYFVFYFKTLFRPYLFLYFGSIWRFLLKMQWNLLTYLFSGNKFRLDALIFCIICMLFCWSNIKLKYFTHIHHIIRVQRNTSNLTEINRFIGLDPLFLCLATILG